MVRVLDNRNLRNICLNMLIKTLEQGELSHYCLREVFASSVKDHKDRAYVKRLFTGTLEKLVYLDYVTGQFSNVPVRKMKPVVRNILRMSLYQLEFMDSEPDYSVIDEAVKLTRKRGLNNLCPFVNAILRKAQRESQNLVLPEHVKVLFPEWIYNLILEQYGKDRAYRYFECANRQQEETWVRFNLDKADEKDILATLESQDINVRKIDLTPSFHAYGISGFESFTDIKAFKEGLIIVQDPSSQLCVLNTADYTDNPRFILDVCAAPGGKCLLAASLYPQADVLARDLTDSKVQLIRDNIKRLGTANVSAEKRDARDKDEKLICSSDLVIADLPCSGLGVTGRKPDILYRLKEDDLAALSGLQRSILQISAEYVKPGGLLVYSTCTVNRGENEENTAWFLREQQDFELLEEHLFLKGEWMYDGFYYAYLKKKPDRTD